MRKKWR